jgi:hypothetical protein
LGPRQFFNSRRIYNPGHIVIRSIAFVALLCVQAFVVLAAVADCAATLHSDRPGGSDELRLSHGVRQPCITTMMRAMLNRKQL